MWLTQWCKLGEEGRAMRYPRGPPGSSFNRPWNSSVMKEGIDSLSDSAICLFAQEGTPFYTPSHGDEQHSHYLACREPRLDPICV